MASIRGRLSEALFTRVAGPDGEKHRERIHGTPGPRWFAPGSPITRVHGDAAMYVGGIRAVLLQTMQPQAMTAVAEHSGFRGDMWGRLARTSRFLAVTTFGTADDAQEAVDIVRSIHDRVSGMMPDGTTYTAHRPPPAGVGARRGDRELPALLPALRAHAARRRPSRDEYVAQTAVVARKLGTPHPPTTEAELRGVARRLPRRADRRPTMPARRCRYLIWHPELPLAARPAVRRAGRGSDRADAEWTREPLGLPMLPVVHDRVAGPLGTRHRTIRWAMTSDPSVATSEADRERPHPDPARRSHDRRARRRAGRSPTISTSATRCSRRTATRRRGYHDVLHLSRGARPARPS